MALSWNEIKDRAIAFATKMEFFDENPIVNDRCRAIPFGHLFHFSVLTSVMHMAWVSSVCDTPESRFSYSKDAVDASCRFTPFTSDSSSVTFLFDLYTKYNSILFAKQPKVKKKSPTE